MLRYKTIRREYMKKFLTLLLTLTLLSCGGGGSGGSGGNNSGSGSGGGSTTSYNFVLSVTGSGAVLINSAQSCTGNCAYQFNPGTVLTLAAVPAQGASFLGWGLECQSCGTNSICNITINHDTACSAQFSGQQAQNYILTVSVSGQGTVTSNPSGINCSDTGGSCEAQYSNGTTVTLTATPAQGYKFSSWGGYCSGSSTTCQLVMNANKIVTATFSPLTEPLTYDTTFSNNGWFNTDYGVITHFTSVRDVDVGYLVSGTDGVCLIDYTGQLKQTFGNNGCVSSDLKYDFAAEPVETGYILAGLNNNSELILRSYNTSGGLIKEVNAGPVDPNFVSLRSVSDGTHVIFAGGSTIVITDPSLSTVKTVKLMDADLDDYDGEGKIYTGIAGAIIDGNRILAYGRNSSGHGFVVAVKFDGDIDTTWANNGWFVESTYYRSFFISGLKLPDGRLLFGGYYYTDANVYNKHTAVFVLSADGTLQKAYSFDKGYLVTSVYTMLLHNNHVIAVCASSDFPPYKYSDWTYAPEIYKFDYDTGTVVKSITFSRPGAYLGPYAQYGADAIIDHSGKLVIAGSESNGYSGYNNFRAIVVRLNP